MKTFCRWLFPVLFLQIIFHSASGQGIVRGKITDQNGEPLIGATVVLKDNRSIGTSADLDGNYSLKITDTTAQTLVISFISFKTIEETVHLKKGEVMIRNFVMKPAAREIQAVEITAKQLREKESYIEQVKINSSVTLDYVSAESIKRTGDANVVTAVARVPGISTTGNIITVRGVGDRYIKTAVNGFKIPTLDPFTNNFKLDLIPSTLVDNVIVTKTASADLPGDWAGAYLSVETKDYPENLVINIESSFAYNPQTTFKNVLTSQRSKTDWLGFDSNLREYPHNEFSSVQISPSLYKQLVALGLGDYFNSIGVTPNTPWNDTYFKLALVELGLLPKALFDDETAFITAKNQFFQGDYTNRAFETINREAIEAAKKFPTNWNTKYRKAPLGFSQNFSVGNQTMLFNRPLGFLFGLRYGSSTQYDPRSTYNKGTITDGVKTSSLDTLPQTISRETNGWSALMNLSYKFNSNNSIGFIFMPNLTGVNDIRITREPYVDGNAYYLINRSQFYEERQQLVYQLQSQHYIPALKLKTDIRAAYTNGSSNAPDFKRIIYLKNQQDSALSIGGSIGGNAVAKGGIHRYYRYLNDDILDTKIAFELPLKPQPGMARKLLFGGGYLRNDWSFKQYDYLVNFSPFGFDPLYVEDFDLYFRPSKFDFNTFQFNGQPVVSVSNYYSESGSPSNYTIGESNILSAYAMADISFTYRLRGAAGLRLERANIFTDAFAYDSLGYLKNDPRRQTLADDFILNPALLNKTSYLPSFNLVYKLKDDELRPVNLRINYSQTVARPGLRELSESVVYDNERRKNVFGNADLKMVNISNYDLRTEAYYKSGDNVSLSLFYKQINNHIELIEYTQGFTWVNVDKSNVQGVELEGRKKLPLNFELKANVTLIKSESDVVRKRIVVENGIKTFVPIDTITRTMYGQAPYVVNVILGYTLDSLGLQLTASYNLQGKRLVIAESDILPNIYELPRHHVDFKISKKLGRHFNTSLTIRDVLNRPVRLAGDNWKLDYENIRYGTSYSLSFGYRF